MKILFIAPRFHTNQFQTIKILMKKNTIYFFSLFKGKTEDYSLITPLIVEQSKFSKYLQSKLALRFDTLYFPKINKLFKKINKIKPDLIIIRIYSRPLKYIVSIIAKIIGCKIVYYDQTKTFGYSDLISFLKYIEFNFSRLIFGAAIYSTILQTPKQYNSLPFVVKTKKKTNKIKKKFQILMIGKFQQRKGHLLIVKALKKLIVKYNISLTMIGEVSNIEHKKNYEITKTYIKENNLSKNCKIITNVNYKSIYNYYHNCNLYVLPSHSEPAAISILEAQGVGRPVICSDTCGTKYYLRNNCSKIFKSNDLKSLVNSIKFFLNRKNYYLTFINKSHENALKRFSDKKFEGDFEKFLKLNF